MNISKAMKKTLLIQLAIVGLNLLFLIICWLGTSCVLLEYNPAKWTAEIRNNVASSPIFTYMLSMMAYQLIGFIKIFDN